MQGTFHEDTTDDFTLSAHSVDLLSCCIEHALVDTAWTAVQAVHRRQNMMFHLESDSSSVSVLPAVFLSSEIVLSESKIFHETDACPRLTYLRSRHFSTNESDRFYVKQISRYGGSFPAYHAQVDIALPPCFLFVFAHCERYFPIPMELSISLGFSAFSWTFDFKIFLIYDFLCTQFWHVGGTVHRGRRPEFHR